MKPTTLAALLITTLTNFTAHAELIKVIYTVYNDNGFGSETISQVAMVFDTSIAPTPGQSGVLYFYPIEALIAAGVLTPTVSPCLDLANLGTLDWMVLEYFPNGNTITLRANDGPADAWISINNMPAAFNPAMDSLPDDPADWVPNPTTSEYHGMTSDPQGVISYHPDFGFSGGTITYSALELPAPSTACSPADLNQDGVLDFFDVSEFLQIFGMGCP